MFDSVYKSRVCTSLVARTLYTSLRAVFIIIFIFPRSFIVCEKKNKFPILRYGNNIVLTNVSAVNSVIAGRTLFNSKSL